jgi:hypothetical protein
MKKTECIREFEKETREGTNKEHFNAIMIEYERIWNYHLDNLNEGKSTWETLKEMTKLDDFNAQRGTLEDRQRVLNHLNEMVVIAHKAERMIDEILEGVSEQYCKVNKDFVAVDYRGGSDVYIDYAPYNLDKEEDLENLKKYLMKEMETFGY